MAEAADSRDFPFSDSDFKNIASLAHDSFGLFLEPCKKQLVYSRLARRLRFLGLKSFNEYCDMLVSPSGEGEKRELLSALTTNVTQFFRENHHFEQLRDSLLPELIEGAKAGKRVRFWSAGCSAGQEVYSLALTLLDLCPDIERFDCRILGTDIDPVILGRAIKGRYPMSEQSAIPPALCQTYMAQDGDAFVMNETVRKLVSFGELNLIEAWPMRGKFDVIFCRNVAIYFDQETQERLWNRFADKLVAGGQLMIGHSERLSGPATDKLKSNGITSFKKL